MADTRGAYKRWIVTMGGSGLLPAGGTWGSLVTCLLLYPLLRAVGPLAWAQWTIDAAGLLIFCVLAIVLGKWAIRHFAREDPGSFVLDEAAGICLSLLFLPPASGTMLICTIVAAFIAFRIFDITKPPPARQLEHLPAGWGILCDDLAAAIYANICCQVLMRWVIPVITSHHY